MEYVKLGTTDTEVSRICLGTMTWGCQNSQDEAFAQMDCALEQGVNFWDTAEMYAVPPSPDTYGTTETIIGNWFAARGRRGEVVLATKLSPVPWARGEAEAGPCPGSVRKAVTESLRRLRTDCIDLYQLHWPTNRPNLAFTNRWSYAPDPAGSAPGRIRESIAAVLEALDGEVKAGRIRHYGLSNDSAWGLMTHQHIARTLGVAPVVSLQNEYSLLDRALVEYNIAETLAYEKISFMAWSPIAMGILSGKYLNRVMPAGARFSPEVLGDQGNRFLQRLTPAVDLATARYVELARRHGLDPVQMAIKFTIRHPHLSTTIIGATSLEQLNSNIAAVDVTLSDELLAEISAIYQQYPMPF